MHIEERENSLLIRFSHDGKSYSFSLAKHNSPVGRSNAKLKITEIEKDIAYGNFDTTLLKYKPRKLGNNPTAISNSKFKLIHNGANSNLAVNSS